MASKETTGYLNTTIMNAVAKGKTRVLKQMLKAGADVNTMSNGKTALILATEGGHLEAMRLLVNAGADVNTMSNGKTALMLVTKGGYLEAMRLLMNAEADVNTMSDGKTPFLIAMEGDHLEAMRLLASAGADVNVEDYYGRPVLKIAAQMGNHQCIELLLQFGADINKQDTGGFTPLIYAAFYGNWECTQTLLNAGADVNICTYQETTALMEACDVRSVDLLLQAGADVNKDDTEGRTALVYAVMDGHWECVKSLLDAGANIDMDNSCKTIVHFVLTMRDCTSKDCSQSHHDRVKCMKLLLSAGAKMNHFQLDFRHVHFETEERQRLVRVLLAAGDKIRLARQKYYISINVEICRVWREMRYNSKRCLSHLCRKVIRKHLLELDRHENLFVRVPKLGLPNPLQKFLLYNTTLDVDEEEEEATSVIHSTNDNEHNDDDDSYDDHDDYTDDDDDD